MTDEEMIAALRAKGYRIDELLTQANCPHRRTRGSVSQGTAGHRSEWWCLDCGKYSLTESPLTPDQLAVMRAVPMNGGLNFRQ